MDGTMDDMAAPPPAKTSSNTSILSVIFVFLAVLLQIVLFVQIALRLSTDDDQMYAAAPVVWAQGGALYSDVPFLQMPYSALLYRGVAAIIGPAHYYDAVVWLNIVLVLLAGWLLAWVAERLANRNSYAAILCFSAFLASTSVFFNAAMLGNHAPMLLLACLLAFLTLGRAVTVSRALWAGVAVGFKLSAVVLGLPLLWWLVRPSLQGRALVAAVAGGALGLLPVLLFVLPQFEAFWFANVTYHQLAYAARGGSMSMMLESVLSLLLQDTALFLLPVFALITLHVKNWPLLGVFSVWVVAGALLSAFPGVTFYVHGGVLQGMAALAVVVAVFVWLEVKLPAAVLRPVLVMLIIAQAFYGMNSAWQGLVLTEVQGYSRWHDQRQLQQAFQLALAKSPCANQFVGVAAIPALGSGLALHPMAAASNFLLTRYPDPQQAPANIRAFVDVAAALTPTTAYLTGVLPALPGEAAAHDRASALGLHKQVLGQLNDFEQPRDVVLYLPECK